VLLVETASIVASLDIAKLIAQALPLGSLLFLADFVPQDWAVPASTAARLAIARQIVPLLLLAAALVHPWCASSKTYHEFGWHCGLIYIILLNFVSHVIVHIQACKQHIAHKTFFV
jgi:hypothetical protein